MKAKEGRKKKERKKERKKESCKQTKVMKIKTYHLWYNA